MIITSILSKISNQIPRHDAESLVPHFEFEEGIPKRIVQTYKSQDCLSDTLLDNIRNIKTHNPDWDYCFFGDADIEKYIERNYGKKMLSVYMRIDSHYGAAKADFFRYLIIYKEGGVYLDIKSSINSSLSSLIRKDDCFLLSYWDNLPGQKHEGYGYYPGMPSYINRGEIIQWYIAASPGHPLLRKVIVSMIAAIEQYNPYINGVGWTGTVNTTGPILYTKTLFDALTNSSVCFPVRWVDIINDFGFEYNVFSTHHSKFLASDYRKNTQPIIVHRNAWLNLVNKVYIHFLHTTHKQP